MKGQIYLLFVLMVSLSSVNAKCLNSEDYNTKCRYAKGDSWCKKNSNGLYAYDDACLLKSESKTRMVIVTGYGLGHTQALNNAFKAAVEQIVGVMVDSEIILKNEKIIKNKILTASRGFIESYDELSTSSSADGLDEVHIKAIVKLDVIEKRIQAIKKDSISVAKSEVKNIYAEIKTKKKSKEDRVMSLKHTFDNIINKNNYHNMLNIKIIGQSLDKSKIIDNKVPLKIKYKISFNYELYKKLIKEIENKLKNVGASLKSKVDFPSLHVVSNAFGPIGTELYSATRSYDSANEKIFPKYSISIIKKSRKKYYTDNWKLNKSIWYKFKKLQNNYLENEIIIQVLDDQGELLSASTESVNYDRFYPVQYWYKLYQFSNNPEYYEDKQVIFAPFFGGRNYIGSEDIIEKTLFIDIEDVKDINNVKIIFR